MQVKCVSILWWKLLIPTIILWELFILRMIEIWTSVWKCFMILGPVLYDVPWVCVLQDLCLTQCFCVLCGVFSMFTCVWLVYFQCLLVYEWCIFYVYLCMSGVFSVCTCVWLVYFLCVTENRDRALGLSEMYQAISQLPQANKDTLAFLILHLLR